MTNEINNNEYMEEEIDIKELLIKLWQNRLFIVKATVISAVVGVIVAISIPKEYSTSVTLAPEVSAGGGRIGGLGALASMAGINLGSSSSGGDALSPDLYPDIVNSTPFVTGLFNMEVKQSVCDTTTTLYNYMRYDQKSPWWGCVVSFPSEVIGWTLSFLKGGNDDEVGRSGTGVNPCRMSLVESRVYGAITSRIDVVPNMKTGVTTINVKMQDPDVAAAVADSVLSCLQDYITDYRTNKARHDLLFAEKLFAEAEQNYNKAQAKYAKFVDSNKNIVRLTYKSEEQRLQNEVNLAYGVYNQLAQQLQVSKAKVQEITPVYTVVQPAVVPLRATSPKKMLILIAIVFTGILAASVWILYGRAFLDELRRGDNVKSDK